MTTTHKSAKAAAPQSNLPPLYSALELLNSEAHRDIVVRPAEDFHFAAAATGIPITLAEAARAQAHYPIVFSVGKKPAPIALTGLPDSGNGFVDAKGRWRAGAYVPAYVRRYPFILAKTNPEADALSLCFDPTADCIETAAGKGNLFEEDEPSAHVRPILGLCEEYEAAARQTLAVMDKLVELDLLMEGQAQLRKDGRAAATFRGFQMISEERLHALPADALAGLVKSGAMALIYAHLLSIPRLEGLV